MDYSFIKDRKYAIAINGNVINKVERFTIRRSIQNFTDSFEITLGNPNNFVSPYVYLGDTVEFIRNGRDIIFKGIIEKKTTSSTEGADNRITISGRDQVANLIEASAPFNTFKNTTDNAIITKTVQASGENYELALEAAAPVNEYDVGPGDTIGGVIQGVARLNGYFMWRRGNTLVKAKIAESGPAKESFYIGKLGINNGQLSSDMKGAESIKLSNVLSYNSEESIEASKSVLEGYSTSGNKSKASLKVKKTIAMFESSAYQLQLRDKQGHSGSSSRLNRKFTMSLSGRNKGEMQREIDLMAKEVETKVQVTVVVRNFRDLELNDIVFLQNDSEGVEKNMVVTGLLYTLDEMNRETTEITLQRLGSYPM